jgi:SAM-dependent methyltransferase
MNSLEERRLEILRIAREGKFLNEKTLLRWHGKTLRNVKLLEKDFSFCSKKVLDIGSGYGNTLLHWSKDSVGIELQKECKEFLSKYGYKTISVNVEDSFEITEQYEAVYSNDLIEHLVAPHLFLARIHHVLREDGLLALGHPITPIYPIDQLWLQLGYNGWLAGEHINFFSTVGIKHVLERAGFRVIKQYVKPFDRLGTERIPALNSVVGALGIHCLSVCQKVSDFKYSPKRLLEFQPEWAKELTKFQA